MDLENEAVETARIGIACMIFVLILLMLIPVSYLSRLWFAEINDKKSESEYLINLSDSYVMELKGEVEGNDIVEFILKNDSLYDYYITIGGVTYSITGKLAEQLRLAGDDTCIWSEDYLINTVFINNSIYDTYNVIPVKSNDDTVSYRFIQV